MGSIRRIQIGAGRTRRSLRADWFLLLLCAVPLFGQDARETFFENQVRPLLAERCTVCHGPQLQSGNLDLTQPQQVARVIVPGDPDASRLIAVLNHSGDVKMPPTGKLPDEDISAVREWIESGAVWPQSTESAPTTDHWSFRPIGRFDPPEIKTASWANTAIDRFVAARLESKGIEPNPQADKLILLRRAKFDLHGLPPTIAEIEEFVGDGRDGAFARLVDRLLASPEYGERWGRHWLDVARYADSTGVDEDHPYAHAWRYRDYVVTAFNDDLPYDQFVREQLAGDLLPADTPGEINTRGIVATGFLGLGPKALAQRDSIQKRYDVVDEQIDTTAKTFLGLTVACSRCHDHKFDPILTTDYYALASIFASTRSYEEWGRNGSESLSIPLVPDDVYQPYKNHQDRVQDRKRIRSTTEQLAVERYRLDALISGMESAMMNARAAYLGQAAMPDGDQSAWVEFLRPRPDSPSYLKPWHEADAVEAQAFAQAQQQRLTQVAADRARMLEVWLAAAEPKYQAGERLTTEGLQDLPTDSLYTGLTEDDAPLFLSDEVKESVFAEETRKRLAALQSEVDELERTSPPQPAMADAVSEGELVAQHVFVRGSYKNEGEAVPKRFPLVIAGTQQPVINEGSGRRELAEWLVSADNPLPARVMVNRVWQGHFGDGLVRTPNNFGKVGERPTHDKLLDFLAREFRESGWSIKALHRLIMTSAVYQQSSVASEQAWDVDPENRLWSRFPRRRLSVEEIRDSYLALSGALDRTVGGTLDAGSDEISEVQRNNRRLNPDDYTRRTLYIPIMRNKVPFLLGLFDFGDATTTTGKRALSNVAPQALYLMNSEFGGGGSRNAKGLARRLAEPSDDFIDRLYMTVLVRSPQDSERAAAQDFISQFASEEAGWTSFCKMLLASNEFHYVD
ncbi:MAG: PSD1 and planctomycete cytochrome C domain-containing protein [Acidobacteria bacterium]|nr:PSD1 and planctomycete cytochrome C domain-containing protein [Acidobacteriota bacterium]